MAGFVHLHVASGFSMQYGTTMPEALVAHAASLGQDALALTDRDGVYGAVRFARACQAAGLDPLLGVDLACAPLEIPDAAASHPRSMPAGPGRRPRTPVRGGALVDPRLPRVTVLARGQAGGLPAAAGWAALCRLVTATHLGGPRGEPVTTPALLAAHAGGAGVLRVLLGPDSEVGRAVLAGSPRRARDLLDRWRALLPPGALVVELVLHGGPEGTVGSLGQNRRLLALAEQAGLPSVLTAATRHLTPADARTADLLDAARRLVLLHDRHLDRVTDAAHLAGTAEMEARAAAIARDPEATRALLERTRAVADDCRLDPRRDLGIGSVHLPEQEVLGIPTGADPQRILTGRCRDAIHRRYPGADHTLLQTVHDRLDAELATIAELGYPTYFLTVAEVTDLVRARGIRVAARGSGAGSLVNHLLGISGVDPIRYGLLMERFCTPLRAELPDIDIDVESARRTEIYQLIIDRFGRERVACVSMMDTYKVRHAVRDVGAALGLPPNEVDEIAKSFPHIRARDARQAIADLPELRTRGLGTRRMQQFFTLVEALDGLPRHIALHPCGVLLSNATLLDRTPVEESGLGFPMSQFDKDDVETLGLLKLDVLGIRMQSAMAHAIAEVERVDGIRIDIDDETQVRHDDETTYDLIRSTRTLGCFQIESPGQRELIGKLGPVRFLDLVIDISLFRPGPVKSDMITPFLEQRHGWSKRRLLHPSLQDWLDETEGVVVYHEQVLGIVHVTTGVSLAQADEVRRAMGSPEGQERIEAWWRPAAQARGYTADERDRIWAVLKSFASFGFCKAHAAAFALPTYQSAWLKAHHTAAFLAGVLTHDPGMYPRRLILDDARGFGIPVLGLDVNESRDHWRVELLDPPADDPDAAPVHALRPSLADVRGLADDELERLLAGQPFGDLGDLAARARLSRPVLERLVLAGAVDALHGIAAGSSGLGRRGRVTRRDLLLHVAELDRWSRAGARGGKGTSAGQLALDLGDRPTLEATSGLPELTGTERVRAELDILGMDVSSHVVEVYRPMLTALGVTPARDLLRCRSRAEVLVAGVKVATQTPPIRSGRRVVFLTVEDGTGPADATFFEDVQGPYAGTVFHSWLLLVRGVVRRTGERGISLRATGAWELASLWDAWQTGGADAVHEALAAADRLAWAQATAASGEVPGLGGEQGRPVLVHASGYRQSPYADTRPAGESLASAPRRLWHASPGSSGH